MYYIKQYTGMFSLTKFYVLIALVDRPMHAYAIYHRIPVDSGGAVFPSRAGVKNVLSTLLEADYIKICSSLTLGQGSRQGPAYEITKAGTGRLKAEAANYRHAISIASIKFRELPPWLRVE